MKGGEGRWKGGRVVGDQPPAAVGLPITPPAESPHPILSCAQSDQNRRRFQGFCGGKVEERAVGGSRKGRWKGREKGGGKVEERAVERSKDSAVTSCWPFRVTVAVQDDTSVRARHQGWVVVVGRVRAGPGAIRAGGAAAVNGRRGAARGRWEVKERRREVKERRWTVKERQWKVEERRREGGERVVKGQGKAVKRNGRAVKGSTWMPRRRTSPSQSPPESTHDLL